MSDGDDYPSAVFGKRQLTVNYKHVLLGNENFWMPATTGMQTTGFHQNCIVVSACKSQYHRLEVTSHIAAGSDEHKP